MNFKFEGQNAEKIRQLLKDEDRLVVPKIFWEFTTEKVLVMSYEQGASITNINYMRRNKIDIKQVSIMLSEIFFKQIFQIGFVHGDPHPGNIFVRKEKLNGKDVTKIVLLDHGLYREYDDHFRYNYCNLWRCIKYSKLAIYTQNFKLLEKSCLELGIKNSPLFVSVLCTKTFDELFKQEDKFSTGKRFNDKRITTTKNRSCFRKA